MLLHVAFVNESLVRFSRRLESLVPAESPLSGLSTSDLTQDLLRFQARYHQLEVSRKARGQQLFSCLATAIRLADHYRDVIAEADRLATLEAQMVDPEGLLRVVWHD